MFSNSTVYLQRKFIKEKIVLDFALLRTQKGSSAVYLFPQTSQFVDFVIKKEKAKVSYWCWQQKRKLPESSSIF